MTEYMCLRPEDIVKGQDLIKAVKQAIKQRRIHEAMQRLNELNDILMNAKRI